MRAYSMIHVVVNHLGFTRFRNALEKTPAGMVPSPAEYPPELPRGVVADTGTYLCICGPLLLVGPTGHLEIGWAARIHREVHPAQHLAPRIFRLPKHTEAQCHIKTSHTTTSKMLKQHLYVHFLLLLHNINYTY